MTFALLALTVFATKQVPPHTPPGIAAESAAPFSFYLVPSDEIGFKDCPQAFQITYDGAINNGFGELDFEAGATPTPVNERVKTLLKDYLPVVEYSFERDGAKYQVESFAAPWKLDPSEDLVAFTRVTISNPGHDPVHATWRASYSTRKEFGRSDLGARKWYANKFMTTPVFVKGEANSGALAAGLAIQRAHLVYVYSGAPQVDNDNLAVKYDFDLAPGQSQIVEFKQPFVPVSVSKPGELEKVRSVSHARALNAVTKFWEGIYARAFQVDVDDPKVVDTMKASLTYDLMARDIEADGKHYTQTVNKFQYHAFFPRDTSFIARSYELMNLEDTARETIEKYIVRDKERKVVKFLRLHPDDWGQSLWALGSYFRTTGDVAFAKEIAGAIPGHLDEFEKSTGGDPLHLWQVAGPYDNELINGHYTSHNLWALLGLEEAENLARSAGDNTTADRAHALYAAFYKVFVDRLKVLTAQDEGYIPPGMDDTTSGNDWENASGGVYPFHVFQPFDPWVTATLNLEHEYKYREGIMTWGPNAWFAKQKSVAGLPLQGELLHDYITYQVDETYLARGEQERLIQDLYSTLVHTSASHGGFETSIEPWGNRDPGDNYPPHGWFAGRYNELIRNMLLREVGTELHVASALAPDWVKPGKTVRVRNGVNSFGRLDYTIKPMKGGAEVTFNPKWRTAPSKIVFHIPWFVNVTDAKADGKALPKRYLDLSGGAATDSASGISYLQNPDLRALGLPASTRHLSLKWTWTQHPDLSYRKAVELWLHKAYEPKPGEDTDHLFPTPVRPGISDPETSFLDTYQLQLVSRTGAGKVHFTLDGSPATAASPEFAGPVTVSDSKVLRAVEVYPNGDASEELRVKLTKVTPINAVSLSNPQPGINFAYYEGQIDKMPDFASLTPLRTGVATIPDLDAIQHRTEIFAITAGGYVKAPTDGMYTFIAGSDDGSKLWIDDQLVVDNDGPHAYSELGGLVALKAGFHKVRIDYFDAGDANFLHVLWKVPGGVKERVPASAWFHG